MRSDSKEWFGCAAWIVFSVGILVASSDLDITTRFGPGPGFFLRMLGIALLVLALVQAITLFVGHKRAAARAQPSAANLGALMNVDEDDEPMRIDRPSLIRFALLSAAMFGYALLLEPLGFLVSTTALAWSCMVLLGRNPWRSLIEAVIAVVAAQLLFGNFLGVNLPTASFAPLAALPF